MDGKGVQNSSILTVKELQASLNSEGKAKSDVLRRRNIRATHRASNSLKAGKCYLRVDGVKQRPKKSKEAAVIAPNKAPRFQSSYNHIPCDIFSENGNDGEPMTTGTGLPLLCIRNKNKRLVAVDKSHVKLFKENGVQSLFLVHSPNNKGTSWGHNVCGPDAQQLINSPIGREFLASWKKMSDGLQAGMVPPSQSALVGNSLDVGQPLLENRRTTTPGNEKSTQGDDVERYASPVNRSSMSECDSNFLAQSDKQTTPVQFPIFGDIDVAVSMSAESNSSSSAQCDIHSMPVQFPMFGDTGKFC